MPSEHDLVPEHTPGKDERTLTTRTMELIVAGLFMVVAAIVMADSWRIGAGWAFDGPQAGYFPFYIGLIMFVSSAIIFGIHLLTKVPDLSNFVSRPALLLVLQVLLPSAVYIALMYFLGIYVASALFIAFFMIWLGKYSILKAAAVGVAVPLILFWVFEIAFLIPLPKGPLETALGF
jgi:hypothetical protein